MNGEAKTAVYTIFGTLAVFKIVTAIWIITLQPSLHGAAFLVLTNLVWFALLAIPLLIGAVFWYRRLRVRARRRQLIHAEWHLDDPTPTGTRAR